MPSWRSLVADVVGALPREFVLADVLRHREEFARHFPANRFIDAKIRQSLQVLRDQGVIEFCGEGRYRRLDIPPVFSPLIDFSAANEFVSRAQAARVALETWVAYNLYCLNCESDTLDALPANTPVADFVCASCASAYQIKSKNGRFGTRVTGAAYAPLLEAIRSGTIPDYVFIEFDSRFSTVVFVDAMHGKLISEDRLIARKPLGPAARRAGWQGCLIDIAGLPTVRLVEPAGLQPATVRAGWRNNG